ncbi:MoaF-related domain-containing protein [Polaribacter sp. L3A8]|uniref:MoaF-related domain-containing protein n=1 Tax=Polaribacter sp. L3A8 TaxID=2686361 RepID=UPI00131B4F8A|nr:MoaF C-terminal domain-containing protein [Polaribacter sp. L3A8]
MKNIVFAIMMLTTIISCKKHNGNENNQTVVDKNMSQEKVISVTGKTFEYNYGDSVYEVHFKSENILHWKCIKGEEKDREEDENYSKQRLNNYTLFLSWIEKDGLGVSQVVNLKKNSVNTFLTIQKEIIPISGTIRELKK